MVTNAHRINAGQHPITRSLDDFFLFPEDEPEQVADLVVDIVANRLPRRFGLDPARDVQVLSCVGFGWYEERAMRRRKGERLRVRLVRKC